MTTPEVPSGAPPRATRRTGIALVLLMLVAANLRPALVTVAPLVDQIQSDLGASSLVMALLAALPVACFGLLGPVAGVVDRRLGIEGALLVAMAFVIVGMLIRLGPDTTTLLTGTVVLGGGIAVGNVLLPALVKRDFSTRPGLATGLYTLSLNVTAAVAAGTVVPLSRIDGWHWRGALAVWVLPVSVAVALLLVVRAMAGQGRRVEPASGAPAPAVRFDRRRASQLVLFTASQSVVYYGVIAWLPSVMTAEGVSAERAGLTLSVATLVSGPVALVVPMLAGRHEGQGRYVVGVAACALVGLSGFLVVPTHATFLWAIVLGFGLGGAFPLALTMFVLRTRTTTGTSRISLTAQSTAYVVASGGPILLGLLHDVTGSWKPGLALLVCCAALELPFGLGAARPGFVTTSEG